MMKKLKRKTIPCSPTEEDQPFGNMTIVYAYPCGRLFSVHLRASCHRYLTPERKNRKVD
jgi:hypothetical protein